jgi:translocation and assembly module TamB
VATVEGVIPLALTGRGPDDPIFPDAPMSIDATIDSLPLDFVPRFTNTISNLRGLAIGRIAARGTVGAPRFAGAVAVREGEIRLDVLGVTVQQVAGTARMRGDSLVIDSISGVSGGPVRLSGGLSLANLTRPAFALKLSATEARVIDNERGQARVTADVTLDGPFEHAHVGGDITVLDAVLYIRESGRKSVIGPGDPSLFTVLDTSLIADRELFPGQASILANLSMDVTVTVNRDTWVRSPEANVEIYSDGPLRLHVDRAKQSLALEGVLATELGQYTYLSRRFDIRRGSATFIGGESGLNPSLQITGEHRVQIPASTELRIQVVIGGTLDHPTISLSSDAQPPLSQSDLLSYMAFGRSSGSLLQIAGSSVGSAAASSSLQTVGAFAGQQLVGMSLGVAVDQLEGRAARSLGVDVFNITPADTYEEVVRADFGSYLKATELEVGRYFNPRTFGSVQARLSADSPPGLRIHHRFWKSYLIEGTFEPRYVLRQPSLSAPESTPVFGVFGAFLVREWRF